MPNFRFILEYDGTDFEGWQLQPEPHRTVQGCLGAAIEKIIGAPVRVSGASRTDSGVHAEGQVASCRFETRLATHELWRAVNATLPPDVAVLSLSRVPDDFHPRRGASTKLYRYRIWNDPIRSPLRARSSLWLRRPLDLAAMRCASDALCGTHDFASFQAAGSNVRSTVRTLSRLDWFGQTPGEVVLEIEGTGFLRHMVRNIVGTLIEVGEGRRSADEIPRVLQALDRGEAGPTAAALGLTLVRIRYEENAPCLAEEGEQTL